MKTRSFFPLVAAAAIVSGCVSDAPVQSSSRHTLIEDSAGVSPKARTGKAPARATVVRTAQESAGAAGERPVRPVRIDERPLRIDDVGPAGRVHQKPSAATGSQLSSGSAQTGRQSFARTAPAYATPAASSHAAAPAAAATAGGAYRVHTVQTGETALGIALANSMTLDQLKALNPELQRDPDRLRVGQGVKVFASAGAKGVKTAAAAAPAERKPARQQTAAKATGATGGEYVVQAGDTLSSIAASQGGSAADWMAANGMKEDDALRLRPGQSLKRPAAGAAGAKTASGGAAAAKRTTAAAETKRDVEAPPQDAGKVVVDGTDSSIEDVLSDGLAGAKEKARAEREKAEKALREAEEAEKARLAEAQKAAEKAKKQAEEDKKRAEEAARAVTKIATADPESAQAAAKAGEYVVQPGEDLFSIALKFDVMPLALRKANSSDLADLKPGQVLKIPPKD